MKKDPEDKRRTLTVDLDAHPEERDLLDRAIAGTLRTQTSLTLEALRLVLPDIIESG